MAGSARHLSWRVIAARGGMSVVLMAAAASLVLVPQPASAVALCTDSSAPPAAGTACLNPAHTDQTAVAFPTHNCELIPSGESATLDGWVFVLPGSGGTGGSSFTSLTLTFDTDPGPGVTEQTLTIPGAPNSGLINSPPNATSKAYVQTPAGWTLLDAQATVSAGRRQSVFNLAHTCPATGM